MSEAPPEQAGQTEQPARQESPVVVPDMIARPRGARRARLGRWARRFLMLAVAVIASVFVTLFTVDIGNISIGGQSLRTLAEARASAFLERPMHIGRISALVTPGSFAFEDVAIDGPKPDSRPFFSAKRITVQVPWWTMFRRELFIEIRLTGWRMVVENWTDGAHLPRLTSRNPSGRPFPLKIRDLAVHASNGEFVYDDHTTPWSVIARNLKFDLVRANNLNTYVGTAQFSGGTTQIQNFLPMRTDFRTRFQLSGSTVRLRHIDLITDGAESHVSGFVNFGRWPEQEYRINSTVDFNRMREIFFAKEKWRLSGAGNFTGIFKFFKGGRELQGEFDSQEAGLGLGTGEWRFPRLHGSLVWTPDRFVVTHADSDFLDGSMRLTYGLVPLGSPRGATATLTALYDDVDLYRFTRQFGWTALEPQGRMRGRVSMAWPNGKFTEGMQGTGETAIRPPDGSAIAPAALAPAASPIDPERPFQKYRPFGGFALGARTKYRFSASSLDFEPGWVGTPTTYVTFSGHARGGPANVPFHVTSHDWQNSDRLFAAIMSNFGSQMGAIEVGGRGTFDGVLTKAFNAPRIEGTFSGESMRAWDVVWGRASGEIAIENGYLDLTNGRIEHPSGGRVLTSGRYSLGYPRADRGEEMNAHVRVEDFPLLPLRHAFQLDDWPVGGTLALADMDLRGRYERLGGNGRMRLVNGTAWDEPFEVATGDLAFEGDGSLRVRGIEMEKGSGRIAGDAWVSWAESRYSFRAETARAGLPVDQLSTFRIERAPLSGRLNFTARGDGDFDSPSWQFDGQITDLYAADEGIGAVRGRLTLANNVLTIDEVVAASDRLQIVGGGTISMNEQRDATFHFRFMQTSLDPYLKFVAPEMPYAKAIASGSLSMAGPLADTTQLTVSLTVDKAEFTFFGFSVASDGELHLAFENNTVKLDRVKFKGQDTSLDLSGTIDATARAANLHATGQASLAVLQAFYPELSASGGAELSAALTGSFDNLALTGRAEITDGRLRHQSLPHGFSGITGPIRMAAGQISVEGLRAVLGEGEVVFGGAIVLDGYRPQAYNLTANGRSMHLRFPEAMQSTVDADLAMRGPIDAPVLSGTVDVLRASYLLRVRPEAGYFGLAGGALDTGGGALVEAPSGFPMALAIKLKAPVMPFIENKNASISGSADVDITGTIDRPIITGRVDLDRGEWVFSGYRYRLQQGGSIDFSNPLKFDPFFDIAATTRVRSTGQAYDVTVRLTGTLSTLDPVVESDPSLPEFQIVSLLFGETPDAGEAELRARGAPQELQAQALRTAMVALLTSPISATVGSVVERATPIDTVQIVPLLGNESNFQQLNPTARITLGKRISNRVYLTYARTLSGAQNEIILIEFDQNDQVSWVLSRNEDYTFALDFRIKHVFR